jgi:ribosomal-protein-serine acetyltransferase
MDVVNTETLAEIAEKILKPKRGVILFTCRIDNELSLSLIDTKYSKEIFRLTDDSRDCLREWLPWLDGTTSVIDTEKFIKSCLQGYVEQKSLTTVVLINGEVAGVVGFNEIDWTNKIAYIGYWLGENFQGRGIMTRVCKVLIDYALYDLKLNKVDIHAAEYNSKSRKVAERLGFTQEGKIRQNEWLYDHFVDHIVYGMLASEWRELN